ncbi:MAG TPA: GNAT family N-acetyltransferase [Gaiellaceae bacterium]|nr:GNAT family N-acetyltransferase [Gaiellaceae bacterium]
MTKIPDAVRRQALHPFFELPTPKNTKTFPLDGAVMTVNPYPSAQMALPTTVDADVPALVEQTRAIAREHGKTAIAWWVAPEHDALAPAFEAVGITNRDTPGYEAIENAMALVAEPPGGRPAGVEVRPVGSFDDFRESMDVNEAAFGMPPLPDSERRERYAEYLEETTGEAYVAVVDGQVAGAAYGAFGNAGINLFGGAVLEEFRGRGVYRALTFARWDKAVERGTPALTVQAGKMSKPICEHLGFELVAPARIFVDDVA